jgi:hypothetical protein
MERYRICPTVRLFVEASKEWKTEKWLYHTEGHIRTGKYSNSLLLFCSSRMPLTNMLNKPGAGNEIKGKNKVSYVFSMDDLKLFSRDETKLQQEIGRAHV